MFQKLTPGAIPTCRAVTWGRGAGFRWPGAGGAAASRGSHASGPGCRLAFASGRWCAAACGRAGPPEQVRVPGRRFQACVRGAEQKRAKVPQKRPLLTQTVEKEPRGRTSRSAPASGLGLLRNFPGEGHTTLLPPRGGRGAGQASPREERPGERRWLAPSRGWCSGGPSRASLCTVPGVKGDQRSRLCHLGPQVQKWCGWKADFVSSPHI